MCTQIIRGHNNKIEEPPFCKRICVEMQCIHGLFESILSIIAKFHINITDYRKHILVYAQ
jgi:hypothetical protein